MTTRALTADNTAFTADTTKLTADATVYQVADAGGDISQWFVEDFGRRRREEELLALLVVRNMKRGRGLDINKRGKRSIVVRSRTFFHAAMKGAVHV